jgi:hypothetical protein
VAQVEQLQGCLVRIASFLERAEATLSKIFPSEVRVDSVEDRGAELYGCFSPHFGDSPSLSSVLPSASSPTKGEAIAAVVTPVLHIMPDLQELRWSSTLPLSMEHMEVDSSPTLCSLESSDVIFALHPPPMALNLDALFAKELCGVFNSFKAAIYFWMRNVDCLQPNWNDNQEKK